MTLVIMILLIIAIISISLLAVFLLVSVIYPNEISFPKNYIKWIQSLKKTFPNQPVVASQ